MITQEYINSFKETTPFKIISRGLLKGDIEKVLLGQNPYRTTSQYEMEDTTPSFVIITIHILIKENRFSTDIINKAFAHISVTAENTCLLLGYIEAYIIYQKKHLDFKLEYEGLLNRIKKLKVEYQLYPCYHYLMSSIENLLANS